MDLKNPSSRYRTTCSMLAGILLGLYLGYRILPSLIPHDTPAPLAAELQDLQALRSRVAHDLAGDLRRMEGIQDARVQFSVPLGGGRRERVKAMVVLTLSTPDIAEEKLAGIAAQVASGVQGLHPGDVRITDPSGRLLNAAAIDHQEDLAFWTGIAINIAKVLGILAALITLRYIIIAVGRWTAKSRKS